MVNDKDNQNNLEEEGKPEFKKEPAFTEREDVNGAGETHTEPRDESCPEDADLGESPVPEDSSQKLAYLSAADITQMSAVSQEVAASFAEAEAKKAEAAEARRAEAELRTRELELEAKKAEWEAARQANRQELEAQARKAEAAQKREQNKQTFELQMNKWSIDKMRGLVSLLLVVGFLATTGIVILLNATGQAAPDMLQTVSSLYSGITGAVLGFYFGRQQQ